MGLIFGSFFNVVGIRVPIKETLLGRSHCPKCNKQLNAVELIPIIGYIIVKGKCKECSSPISLKYPIICCSLIGLCSGIFVKSNTMLEC